MGQSEVIYLKIACHKPKEKSGVCFFRCAVIPVQCKVFSWERTAKAVRGSTVLSAGSIASNRHQVSEIRDLRGIRSEIHISTAGSSGGAGAGMRRELQGRVIWYWLQV